MLLRKFAASVASSLWFVPVMCVLAGAAISFGTITLDRAFDYQALSQVLVGRPTSANAVLTTIAVSMVSLATLVLTITMVVVQLAMGQFSPRIVQRILRDKPSQLAIGLFVATFVHAVLTIREVVDRGDGTGQVPSIAVATSYLLVLASIAALVIYVHHIGQSLRVSALIELVGHDTRKLVDRRYPDAGPPPPVDPESPRVVAARKSGVVTRIATDALVAEAERADCVLELVPALGAFVPAGGPLFIVHGRPEHLDENRLFAALSLKLEPTLDEDVAYGVRLLVDVAERSLSESPFQDPTTAVQAIDRLHDVLRQLARRPFPDGRVPAEDGRIRLLVKMMTWEDYVHLAFDEIRMAGAGSPQVSRRLVAALMDLRRVALPERIAVLDEQARLLRAATVEAMHDERDIRFALDPDREGLGAAAP
ncbi:MAG TPA: DUF2254 domain-containing protein [Actinomycetota bacterium]|nr:DUF2254 domain-containing protein [Actinomycetota bacterium]